MLPNPLAVLYLSIVLDWDLIEILNVSEVMVIGYSMTLAFFTRLAENGIQNLQAS